MRDAIKYRGQMHIHVRIAKNYTMMTLNVTVAIIAAVDAQTTFEFSS